MRAAGLPLFLAVLAGCSPPSPPLLGPVDRIVAVEGVFLQGPRSGAPFKGGRSEAQEIGRIVAAGASCGNAKWQGLAVLHLVYDDGRRRSVELTLPKDVVMVDHQSYTVRMADLLDVLDRLAAPRKP